VVPAGPAPGRPPALLAALDAAGRGGDVLPLSVFDDRLWGPSGAPRRRFLLDCLADVPVVATGSPYAVARAGSPPALDRYQRVKGS
jgi:deoxyribodipyrimidine photo-lyase